MFHNAAKIRETRNTIREIECSNGILATSREEIKTEAERFFCDFLTFNPPDYEGMKVDALQNLLPFRCSEIERTFLEKEVTTEEIRRVIFSMPGNKLPGPDLRNSLNQRGQW